MRNAMLLLSALLLAAPLPALAAPVIGAPTQDGNGVLHYPVTSTYQGAAPNDLRIVLPQDLGAGQRRFLYVLPVEAGTQSVYGDPVAVTQALGVLDALHLILVVPSFSQLPWYADHPTDPTVRQESYLVDDLVPAVDSLVPETAQNPGPPRRLLLGFSKSGTGSMSLILRHPATFDAIAAWDAPLYKTQLSDLPGATPIFGTQANYDTYALPSALPAHATEFPGPTARLWLGGYSSQTAWRDDMIAAHDAMTALGIVHAWADGPQRPHRWDSGWLSDAVTFLDQAAPAILFTPDAGVGDAGGEGGLEDGGAPDSGADAGATDAGGGGGVGGQGGEGGQAGGGARAGCGCDLAGSGHGEAAALLSALLLALAARRRRR
jgi:MYXO-CTERM domain-containing protein